MSPDCTPVTQWMSAYACVFDRETAATGGSETKPECCGYRASIRGVSAIGSNTGRDDCRVVIDRFGGNVDNSKHRSGGSVASLCVRAILFLGDAVADFIADGPVLINHRVPEMSLTPTAEFLDILLDRAFGLCVLRVV